MAHFVPSLNKLNKFLFKFTCPFYTILTNKCILTKKFVNNINLNIYNKEKRPNRFKCF